MPKFTEIEKGTFIKNGKEYDYITEVEDTKDSTVNARIRIIEERPAIRKIRTRYDPEIKMYGNKNATMEIMLGYDKKELDKSLWRLITLIMTPIICALIVYTAIKLPPIIGNKSWILIMVYTLILIFLSYKLITSYGRVIMSALADHLKAREIKKLLKKEGMTNK